MTAACCFSCRAWPRWFCVEFRNIGVKLPTFELGGMVLSLARLTAFLIALASMIGVYLFLKRNTSVPRSAPLRRTARSCR